MLPKNNYRSPNAEPDYWGSMSVRDEADAPPPTILPIIAYHTKFGSYMYSIYSIRVNKS